MSRSIVWTCLCVSAGAACCAFGASVGPRSHNTTVVPSDYSAYLSTSDGGLYAQTDATWGATGGGFKVSWVITPLVGAYRYEYTMTDASGGSLARDISHFIIELSQGVLVSDLHNVSSSNGTAYELTVATHTAHDGNPGMPAPVYGLKVDNNPSPSSQTFSFEINRPPVWGNFYAKDGAHSGSNVFAHNMGFGSEGVAGYFIARPDTVIIPLPAAVWAGFALLGAAGVLSQKR